MRTIAPWDRKPYILTILHIRWNHRHSRRFPKIPKVSAEETEVSVTWTLHIQAIAVDIFPDLRHYSIFGHFTCCLRHFRRFRRYFGQVSRGFPEVSSLWLSSKETFAFKFHFRTFFRTCFALIPFLFRLNFDVFGRLCSTFGLVLYHITLAYFGSIQ